MAFTDVELNEFAPEFSSVVATVGTDTVIVTPTVDSFAVFDATTETSSAFTSGVTQMYQLGQAGGYVWGAGYRAGVVTLVRIDPTTGGVTRYASLNTMGSTDAALATEAGGLLWVSRNASGSSAVWTVDISTGTWTSKLSPLATTGRPFLVPSGGVMYLYGSKKRWTISTGAPLTDLANTMPNVSYGPLVVNGVAWSGAPTGRVIGWNLAANAEVFAITPGTGQDFCTPALGPDGLLYFCYPAVTVVVDPATFAYTVETFTTNRGERRCAFTSNGNIYTPSGQPR